MKVRLQVQTAAARTEVEHAGPVVTIGRNPDAGLALDGVGVSWEHARIDLAPKKAAVSDLKSTNGTYLNGQPVQGSAPLKVGDTIRLGQEGPRLLVIALELSAAPTVPQTVPAAPTRAEAFAVPGLLDVPTRGDDEVLMPPPPAARKNGKAVAASPPVSATRKLLLRAIQQQQTVQTKQKRSLWAVGLTLLALLAILGAGGWIAYSQMGKRLDTELGAISQKLDSQKEDLSKQLSEHVGFMNAKLDSKFIEVVTKMGKIEEDRLKSEGKLTDLTKQLFNLNELNEQAKKVPAAAPKPPVDNAKAEPPPGDGPLAVAPQDLPPAPPPPPVPQNPADQQAAAAEAAKVEFKPGDRIDVMMKNGNVYTGSLYFLSAEKVKILSNPNWPERPSEYDMSDVQAIQTKDGIYAFNKEYGTFVNALSSYRFNKDTGTFEKLPGSPGDIYLSENVKIIGAKTVNGLYSLGQQGEHVITLPLPMGPASIPAYQFETLVTSKGIFAFNREANKYDFKTHTQIAAEIKESNDRNWKAFTEERYRKNMEGYEAATRRVAALSAFWGTRWWWWY